MARLTPFLRVERSRTIRQEGRVTVIIRVFWADRLEPTVLRDLQDVRIEYIRTVRTRVDEYRLTVDGDTARCKVVVNAIAQTIRGNEKGRQALVALANRQHRRT